jgi:hypothetical protein
MEQIPKKKRGGRKPGQTNLKTRLLIAEQRVAINALAEKMTPEALKSVSSLETLRICMVTALQRGDFEAARIAAAELAPYEYAKRSPEAIPAELPADLKPDAPPAPDEPGPPEPVL